MCGILGFISWEPVAPRIAAAADRLQTRGEHSTGVATFDGTFFWDHAGLGPASQVFQNYDLGQLRGTIGIAHTRYATTGGGTPERLLRNRQPVGSDRPGLRTCANGDLVNLHSARQALMNRGYAFQTEVDSKVIQNVLIERMLAEDVHGAKDTDDYVARLFRSVEKVHVDLTGAYSCLTITERGLLAFKDPNGIRPCSVAFREKPGDMFGGREVAFASESSVFNYFGDYHDVRELEPGEMIFVERDTLKVHQARAQGAGKGAFCFFEFVYFARPDSKFKGRVVESARRDLGKVLAREFQSHRPRVDVVLGVPGTGVSAGAAMAHAWGVPFEYGIIKVGTKRSFQETTQEKREKAIDDKFLFIKEFIEGKSVAVVDDSNVRGTTARKLSQRLFKLGAREVHLYYFCPEVIGPCFYGIDTPDESKLIAAGRTNEQIRDWIGATSVNYISITGLIEGLGLPQDELCLACVTKRYPTNVAEAQDRVALRNAERIACAEWPS
ncbi:MAG: amidophosphoribosyltransferase [Candidatus Brocadiae bacterium]|nr:amidophosphoribosyltransferase [Candidatus Brocadiia bacterium]